MSTFVEALSCGGPWARAQFAQSEIRHWLPHEDNVLNKFRILKERHVQMRKPYQSPARMKNSSYYIAPAGDRTHDLPHTVASNMVNVSQAPNHSATDVLSLMVFFFFQVWDFVIVKDETYLITGSGDMELRVWSMCYNQQVCHASVACFMVT